MNCEEVRAKLALHVAGDIERKNERQTVDSHLRACGACRAVAAEWEASQRLLDLHQPPEFDADFFDGLRRDVLRQISEPPPPSLFARLLGQPFGQRTLTYAAVFSLLVCAAIFTSHFLRRSPTPSAEVAREDQRGSGTVVTNAPQSPTPQTQGGGTVNAQRDGATAPRPQPKPSAPRGVRHSRDGVKASAPAAELVSPSRKPDVEQVANVPGVPAGAAVEREMLRIELQTSDPNVRIIWLSPRETTDGASSNKLTDKR